MKKHDEMTLKIAEIVFEKGDQLIEQNKKKAAKIRHISYTVSGMCAVIITGVGIWHFSSSIPKPSNDPNPPDLITATETTAETNSTALSTAPVIKSTEKSSVNTTTSTTLKKTISSNKSTESSKATSVSKETTISSVTIVVSNDNTTNNTVVSNTATETASSADNNLTQPSSSVTAETTKTTISNISTSVIVTTNEVTESTQNNIITSTKPDPPPIITTNKQPTLEEVVEFPTEGKFPMKFTVVDEASKEVVKDLDIELYTLDNYSADANFIDKLAEWNTADSETYSCELPYNFENQNSYSAYGVVIKNMPEGYVYSFSGENSKCFPVDYRPITIWTDVIIGNDTHEHEYVILIEEKKNL